MKLENALGVTTIPESKTIQAGNSVISNTKTGSFGDITFYEAGKYTFTVTEVKPAKVLSKVLRTLRQSTR